MASEQPKYPTVALETEPWRVPNFVRVYGSDVCIGIEVLSDDEFEAQLARFCSDCRAKRKEKLDGE